MAEKDPSGLITPGKDQQPQYKYCHRGNKTEVILAPAPTGAISQPNGLAPIGISVKTPCIGPDCRMWNPRLEPQGECEEVHAAQNAVITQNVIQQRGQGIVNQLGAVGQAIAEGINLLLSEIREIKLIVSPPLGGKEKAKK